MAQKPTKQDFKQAWVEWSNWRRVPTKGKAEAEEEFEDFVYEQWEAGFYEHSDMTFYD